MDGIVDEISSLKPFYVYELVDSRNNHVFYVGKGVGRRANQHALEARSSEDTSGKIRRIKEIESNNGSVTVRVIGRFTSEKQAYAVEATLIHWIYGMQNLTNIQGGHGCSTIRNFEDTSVLEGIDIPKSERRADGVYSLAMRKARETNGITQFMENIKAWLEDQLDIGFTKPDTSESNTTKIYSYFDSARIRVGAFHSKEPSLWLALEPVDNALESRQKFLAVCEDNGLKVTKNKKLARLQDYRGTRDLDVLVRDVQKMIDIVAM